MHISKIQINNFRNFKQTTIEFNEKLNIIIGANNSGKTNLLTALALVTNTNKSKRLSICDFNRNNSFSELKKPLEITISITISKSNNSVDELTHADNLAMIAPWLTKFEENFEAQLTYHFYLPQKEQHEYSVIYAKISEMKCNDGEKANQLWKLVDKKLIRRYVYRIWGGLPENQSNADHESLDKFDFQFLDAIRDVERDMLTGRNAMLRDILKFFMDYKIKDDASKTQNQKECEIDKLEEAFSDQASTMVSSIQARIKKGKDKIFEYQSDIGNADNIEFDGDFSEADLFSFLGLIVKNKTGITLPATHNGLGYNNLIFMALLLAKMQVNSDGNYLGSNAKTFPLLVIEEPEAHLHPSMQYQLMNFIRKNQEQNKNKQIFITSHSPNITATAQLENIVCLHQSNNQIDIAYPAKVFPDTEEGNKSRKYVQRFLDATKSDMLFANKIIFVEGIAEELLMHTFAKFLNVDLTGKHITVINVGGRYFEHFLYLFGSNNETQKFALTKKVAYLTDRDHSRKIKKPKEGDPTDFTKCYPFEFGVDHEQFEYNDNSTNALHKVHLENNVKNICCFMTEENSSTFEYDIAWCNSANIKLITDSIGSTNQNRLRKLMEGFNNDQSSNCLMELLDTASKDYKRI